VPGRSLTNLDLSSPAMDWSGDTLPKCEMERHAVLLSVDVLAMEKATKVPRRIVSTHLKETNFGHIDYPVRLHLKVREQAWSLAATSELPSHVKRKKESEKEAPDKGGEIPAKRGRAESVRINRLYTVSWPF